MIDSKNFAIIESDKDTKHTMLRQYGAQRFRPSFPLTPKEITTGRGKHKRTRTVYVPQENDMGYRYRIGTIDAGTTFKHDGETLIVLGWKNREYTAARKVNGKYTNSFMRGGHLAVCRSTRNGQYRLIADHLILKATE